MTRIVVLSDEEIEAIEDFFPRVVVANIVREHSPLLKLAPTRIRYDPGRQDRAKSV